MSGVLSAADRLTRFHECRTAEEYLELLDVPYDPRVVNVHRLHILRHFAAQLVELHEHRTAPESAGTVIDAYREALIRSYEEFTSSTALDHRLFKVLKDHAPQAFVPAAEVGVRREESA